MLTCRRFGKARQAVQSAEIFLENQVLSIAQPGHAVQSAEISLRAAGHAVQSAESSLENPAFWVSRSQGVLDMQGVSLE